MKISIASYTVTDNSGAIKEACAEAIQGALEGVGLHLAGEAAEELKTPMPHKEGLSPRPYIDTGNLKNSIAHTVEGQTLYVGTPVEYGIYIHEGTSRIVPNRFIKNAFDRNMDQVQTYIEDFLKSGEE